MSRRMWLNCPHKNVWWFGAQEAIKVWEQILKLRTICENFIDWLSHHNPPWEAYCTLTSGWMILPHKQPDVIPVSVRETWLRLSTSCVLCITVTKANNAYKYDQLCTCRKAVTDGVVHSVQDLWGDNFSTDNSWFLVVDAKSIFN